MRAARDRDSCPHRGVVRNYARSHTGSAANELDRLYALITASFGGRGEEAHRVARSLYVCTQVNQSGSCLRSCSGLYINTRDHDSALLGFVIKLGHV